MFTLLLRRFRGISKLKRKTSHLRSLKQLAMIGILVLGAHVIAMMAFEGLDLWTAIWLTTTTTTTVGYGDISAASWQGQLSTMVLIYGGGVFIVAQGAGLFFEHRSERARLKQLGEWIWNMSEHIIVINTPCHNRTRFMERVFDEFEASKPRAHEHQDFLVESKHLEFLLITEGYPEGLPKGLEERNVKLQAGRGDDPGVLEDANIREARGVVILAIDPSETQFAYDDSLTFDIVHRIRSAGYDGTLVAEVVDANNRPRILEAGATAVVLPVRAFPGLLSRALFHPGMEKVIESLFDSQGNECVSMRVDITDEKWRDVIRRYVDKGVGTPVAYSFEGEVESEPNLKTVVRADTIYVLTGSKKHS